MEKISVTIITYNEEKNIERCLESISWADEIVVVDSHSTDKTVEICRKYTDKIYLNPFPGHIEQKNIAIDKAVHPWILSLDADEQATTALRQEIEGLLKAGPDKEGYRVPRRSYYLGRWINHSGWYPNRNIRFFRKEKGRWGGINPHDSISVPGVSGDLAGDLLHYPYENIAENLRTIDNFTTIIAGEMEKKGKKAKVTDLLFRPHLIFLKKFFLKKGFLDGIPGLIISTLTAYYSFCKYAKLWELNRKKEWEGAR